MIVFIKSQDQLRKLEPDSPSPERIQQLTAEIRKHWTPRERCRRSGFMPLVEITEMPLQPRRKGFWGEPQ